MTQDTLAFVLIGIEILQTGLIGVAIAQIYRLSGENSHLASRQNFLETLLGQCFGKDEHRAIPKPRAS